MPGVAWARPPALDRDQVVAGMISIGAGQPEGCDGRQYQTRIQPFQVAPTQTQPIDLAGWQVQHQHVGSGHELSKERRVAGPAQVESRSPLISVEVEEEAAPVDVFNPIGERAPTPGRVSLGRLHLHYVGASVGQQAGTVRTRHHVAVFQGPSGRTKRNRESFIRSRGVAAPRHWPVGPLYPHLDSLSRGRTPPGPRQRPHERRSPRHSK